MSGRFAHYSAILRQQAAGVPRLLVDLDSLDSNIDHLRRLKPPSQLRLVAKSLPAPGLIRYIGSRLWGELNAPRLMVFHLPFLQQLLQNFPGADILMGKPLPIEAIDHFHRGPSTPDADIQWLVDTETRATQLIRLAKRIGKRLQVSLELDVGMHRGGFAQTKHLEPVLDQLLAHPEQVELRGFMGYDAHAAKAPWPASPDKACRQSWERYAGLLDFARSRFQALEERPWCINGAGSPTLSMHEAESPLNDFSMGSALLKPANFDLPSLDDFEPAAWIATPVIKRLKGIDLPFLEKVPSGKRDTLFIYGGRWMATPDYPKGMQEHKLYGQSSNQQMMTVPRTSDIGVDDFVFFRPNQSEAVLLQFGRLFAVRGERLEALWPVLSNELDEEPTGNE